MWLSVLFAAATSKPQLAPVRVSVQFLMPHERRDGSFQRREYETIR